MSIIEDIQKKALCEGKIKAQTQDSFKIVSVRPNAQLAALIEVLSFLDGKSPSDFIHSNFGQALAEFTLESKAHVEPLKKSMSSYKRKYKDRNYKEGSAFSILEKICMN